MAAKFLSSYLIRFGVVLLVIALASSIAALYTVTSEVHASRMITSNKSYSIVVLNLFREDSGLRAERVSSIDLTILNRGPSTITVISAPYTNISVSVKPGENISLQGLSPLDSIVIRSNNAIHASLNATAHLVSRPYLSLSVVALLIFLAGSIMLMTGVILRLSGVEAAFTD
jgi:hypothetical protein